MRCSHCGVVSHAHWPVLERPILDIRHETGVPLYFKSPDVFDKSQDLAISLPSAKTNSPLPFPYLSPVLSQMIVRMRP